MIIIIIINDSSDVIWPTFITMVCGLLVSA